LTLTVARLNVTCSELQSGQRTLTNLLVGLRVTLALREAMSLMLLELELLGPDADHAPLLLAHGAARSEVDLARGLFAPFGLGSGEPRVAAGGAAEPPLTDGEFARLSLLDAFQFLLRVLLAVGAESLDLTRAVHTRGRRVLGGGI